MTVSTETSPVSQCETVESLARQISALLDTAADADRAALKAPDWATWYTESNRRRAALFAAGDLQRKVARHLNTAIWS